MSTSSPGAPEPAYHAGMRQLQDRFDTRRLADRLDERLGRTAFTDEDRAFIESRPLFFLATADAEGRPDCSYKGGAPGFVRVTAADELAFPSYDGNGMFRSLGNILVNPAVALLFIDFEPPNRLRVNGAARVVDDDPLLASLPGAQFIVRVRARGSFRTARATSIAWRSPSPRPTCRAPLQAADAEVEALRRLRRRAGARRPGAPHARLTVRRPFPSAGGPRREGPRRSPCKRFAR